MPQDDKNNTLQAALNGAKDSPAATISAGEKVVVVANDTGKTLNKAIIYHADANIPKQTLFMKGYDIAASVDWKQVGAYSSLVLGGAAMATGVPGAISWGLSTSTFAVADLSSIYGKLGITASDMYSAGVSNLKWGNNIVENFGKAVLSMEPTYMVDRATRSLGDNLNSMNSQ